MFAEMPHVRRHGLVADVHAVLVLVVRMLRLPCCATVSRDWNTDRQRMKQRLPSSSHVM